MFRAGGVLAKQHRLRRHSERLRAKRPVPAAHRSCGYQGDRETGAWQRIAARGLTHQTTTVTDRTSGAMVIRTVVDTLTRTGPGCPAQPTGTRARPRSAHPPADTGHAERHWARASTCTPTPPHHGGQT